jgi:hypothetical protein
MVDARFGLHLIVDNDRTHKTALVKAGLAKHLRFHLHFPPKSASWLNPVERLFAQNHRRPHPRLSGPQRGRFWGHHREHQGAHYPFVWTIFAYAIIAKTRQLGSHTRVCRVQDFDAAKRSNVTNNPSFMMCETALNSRRAFVVACAA